MKNTRSRTRVAALLPFLLALSLATPAAARPRPSAEPPAGPLEFVHDDYASALATARAENKPLFVEFWAPW